MNSSTIAPAPSPKVQRPRDWRQRLRFAALILGYASREVCMAHRREGCPRSDQSTPPAAVHRGGRCQIAIRSSSSMMSSAVWKESSAAHRSTPPVCTHNAVQTIRFRHAHFTARLPVATATRRRTSGGSPRRARLHRPPAGDNRSPAGRPV